MMMAALLMRSSIYRIRMVMMLVMMVMITIAVAMVGTRMRMSRRMMLSRQLKIICRNCDDGRYACDCDNEYEDQL